MYLQFGAGLCAPRDWVNVDASPTLRLQRLPLVGGVFQRGGVVFPENVVYGDIVKGLPYATGSCNGLYSSHVLEHLSRDDCEKALGEAYRLLKPGGVFRAVLPDLRAAVESYVARASAGDSNASHAFMEETYLGLRARPRTAIGVIRGIVGNSQHLWMWDRAAMIEAFRGAGFVSIRDARFGDSADPMFALVEDRCRFDAAFCIEGKKAASAG